MERFWPDRSALARLHTIVVQSLLWLVALLVLLLVVRRAEGALVVPLTTTQIWLCGLLLCVWAYWAQRTVAGSRHIPARLRPVAVCLPMLLLVAGCFALPWSEPRQVIALGLAGMIGVKAWFDWRWQGRESAFDPGNASLGPRDRHRNSRSQIGEGFPEDVTAELIRRRNPEGGELLMGRLRAEFAPGQRVAMLHAPFCPPFCSLPQCDVEQVGGAAATARVAQVLPQGVRFEVKLAAIATQPAEVIVEFSAIANNAAS